MGASSGQEPRMSIQEVNSIVQNVNYASGYASAQSQLYRYQAQQDSQQYIDNQKIKFILENQRMLGYRINPYSLTRYELDLVYKKLYNEVQEYNY